MIHVSPLRNITGKPSTVVHAVKNEKYTFCGFQYLSDEQLNGRPIPRAASTNRDLNCGRCRRKFLTITYELMQRMDAAQTEQVYEFAEKISR